MTTLYKRIISISTNPLEFANTELKELNKFLETGKCNSVLFDDKKNKLGTILNKQELFEYCRYLTTRDAIKFELDITREDFLESQKIYAQHFSPKAIQNNLPKDDAIFTEDETKKINNLVALSDSLKGHTWFLARQAQCLFWVKDFFEKFISSGGNKKEPKQGYQVKNKEIVIPALYEALRFNKLIAEISEDDFKKAFVDGQGSIQWLLTTSDKKNSLDAKSLIHFIERMASQDLISRDGYIVITSKIFIDKNGNYFKSTSLTTATKEEPKNKEILNRIVDSLKSK